MRRRDFIALLGCTGTVRALAARAQATVPVRRVGVLTGIAQDAEAQLRIDALRRRLRELGWIEGTNIETEIAPTSGEPDLIRRRAKELVDSAPDVLVGASLPAAVALQEQTRSIPIIFLLVTDPVANRLVTNLAQPDANMTGFTNFQPSIGGKWFEILTEIAPRIAHVGLMFDSELFPHGQQQLASIREAASSAGVALSTFAVHDAADIERAIAGLSHHPNCGLIVLPDNTVVRHRKAIVSLCAEQGVPTIYPYRYFAADGGLVSYGIDTIALYSRVAQYVDRVLRGAKVAELPVQHPMNFELVINLKAAKALGLDVSPTIIASANEVIE